MTTKKLSILDFIHDVYYAPRPAPRSDLAADAAWLAAIELADLDKIYSDLTRLRVDLKAPPLDPLDVEYDGVKLRELIRKDQWNRREGVALFCASTPTQRAAISAHWSAELRARVASAKEHERTQVVLDTDGDA